MSFWSDETWRKLEKDRIPVEPFDETHLEEAKYILAIGDEIYTSSSSQGNTIRKLSVDEGFAIGPGQFAYILTYETVRLPMDTIGFISINASIKFAGLVNISGFHVDPGYHGRLIFSVFNAGPGTIHLKRGERIFPLWIADLDKATKNPLPKSGYDSIPAKLITAIAGNFTTAFELDGVVKQIRRELDDMKVEVAHVKSIRMNLVVVVGIIALLFSGVIAERTKALYFRLFTESSSMNHTIRPTGLKTPNVALPNATTIEGQGSVPQSPAPAPAPDLAPKPQK